MVSCRPLILLPVFNPSLCRASTLQGFSRLSFGKPQKDWIVVVLTYRVLISVPVLDLRTLPRSFV